MILWGPSTITSWGRSVVWNESVINFFWVLFYFFLFLPAGYLGSLTPLGSKGERKFDGRDERKGQRRLFRCSHDVLWLKCLSSGSLLSFSFGLWDFVCPSAGPLRQPQTSMRKVDVRLLLKICWWVEWHELYTDDSYETLYLISNFLHRGRVCGPLKIIQLASMSIHAGLTYIV